MVSYKDWGVKYGIYKGKGKQRMRRWNKQVRRFRGDLSDGNCYKKVNNGLDYIT